MDLPACIDASRGEKFESVCNVNGKAVAVPSNAEKILVVDPATGQASAIDLPAGIDASRHWTWNYVSVCNANGKAVAFRREKNFDRGAAAIHSAQPQTPPQRVAALLSYWMYTEEPEPPHLEHACVEVHRVVYPASLVQP